MGRESHLPFSRELGNVVLNHSVMDLLQPPAFSNFSTNHPVSLCLMGSSYASPNLEISFFPSFHKPNPLHQAFMSPADFFLKVLKAPLKGLYYKPHNLPLIHILSLSVCLSPLFLSGLPKFFFLSQRALLLFPITGSDFDINPIMLLCRRTRGLPFHQQNRLIIRMLAFTLEKLR